MSDKPNAKLGHIIEILLNPHLAPRTNAQIAAEVGCDEGMVRRGRQIAQIEILQRRLAEVEAENATLREANARPHKPRPKRNHPPGFYPLWEWMEGESVRSTIPILDTREAS